MKTWLKPKSVKNIQVFLDFANFYKKFIKSFNRIAISLISILETIFELANVSFFSIKAKKKKYT